MGPHPPLFHRLASFLRDSVSRRSAASENKSTSHDIVLVSGDYDYDYDYDYEQEHEHEHEQDLGGKAT